MKTAAAAHCEASMERPEVEKKGSLRQEDCVGVGEGIGTKERRRGGAD